MEQIVFVEFQDGKPFTLLTHGKGEEVYDIEWCKRDDQLYYHNSGSGLAQFTIPVYSDTDFWIVDHLQAVHGQTDEPIEKTMDIPKEFYGPIDGWAIESRCEYCTVCDDWFPEHGECQHLFWSDTLGGYGGCGCDDDINLHKHSFLALLEKTGIAIGLRTALKLQSYFIDESTFYLCGMWFDEQLENLTHDEEELISDGLRWLESLEPKVTIEAEQITIKWIDEYLMRKRQINRT